MISAAQWKFQTPLSAIHLQSVNGQGSEGCPVSESCAEESVTKFVAVDTLPKLDHCSWCQTPANVAASAVTCSFCVPTGNKLLWCASWLLSDINRQCLEATKTGSHLSEATTIACLAALLPTWPKTSTRQQCLTC